MKFAFNACLLAGVIGLSACGGGGGAEVNESKPIAEVKQEAAQMDTSALEATVKSYVEAINAKKPEMKKLEERLKEIPLTKMLGDEAKQIKTEFEDLTSSVAALTERYHVYIQKLKDQGVDISAFSLNK